MTQQRMIALDVGDVRIGVAASDETNTIAIAVSVIKRKDMASDIKQINSFVQEYNAGKIIVGLPLTLRGEESIQAKKVRDFINTLTQGVTVPIETFDERLTTAQSEKFLISADVSRSKRRKVIDKMAAQLILQTYMETKGKN